MLKKMGLNSALEPLHPMYKTSLSFLVTLSDALDFIEDINSAYLGVWIDTYHVWWDSKILENLSRAKGKILGVHINDFLLHSISLSDWGLPGQGVIPINQILRAIASTGWQGMYSVEVISEKKSDAEYCQLLEYCIEWFNDMVL